MKKRFLSVLLASLFLFAGCDAQSPDQFTSAGDTVSEATRSRYRVNEIDQYQGARLDPAIGPRDNSIKGIQQVDTASYALSIGGLVDHSLSLSYDEVRVLDAHERLITLYCVEGWQTTILWKGVLLGELIAMAGAKPEAVTVIFGSVDGYTTSLPLQTIKDKALILAYSANGLDLPPAMGYPFIVVAEDKLGYKWARWVNSITLSDDADYRGYWEQAGYSNEAELPR